LKNQDINEEEDLDELWNMIVVCPHHHKVLHYMNGEGFEKIVMVDGILNFINNAGDVLFINRNYHLNELK
jgi:ABC-type tungstate transport system permease subunit